MKPVFHLIAAITLLPFTLTPAKSVLFNYTTTKIIFSHPQDGNGQLLVYTGNVVLKVINAPLETIVKTKEEDIPKLPHKEMKWDIGLHVEIDTSIGIRYGVTIENGNMVMVNTAMFYKFDNPNQTILYDYQYHSSQIHQTSGSGESNSNLTVIGQQKIDSFLCTHLRDDKGKGNHTDYWMSKQIPGFQKIGNKLISVGSQMQFAFNDNIFKWGGLVKMTGTFTVPKSATFVNFHVALNEANPAIVFPASDFDPPSK